MIKPKNYSNELLDTIYRWNDLCITISISSLVEQKIEPPEELKLLCEAYRKKEINYTEGCLSIFESVEVIL